MSFHGKPIEDLAWQSVKRAIVDPDHCTLPEEQIVMLNRIVSLARLLDRHPQGKTALNIHQQKYSEICRSTALNDLRYARELNVSHASFDYEFWHNWLVNDIVNQIQSAKERGDLRNWSDGHANLLRAIGEKPTSEMDPKLIEKHTFIIHLNQESKTVNINMKEIDSYSRDQLKALSDGIYTEISEDDAEEIFKT